MRFPGIKEQNRKRLLTRIRLIEKFLSSEAVPVDIIPVLPPDLRTLDGGRFSTPDLLTIFTGELSIKIID